MSGDEDNITYWRSEYGRLILKELERLNEGQIDLKRDMDKKFTELNEKLAAFKNTEKDVDDLKKWKSSVTEIWSVTQMKEAKDELYEQKNQWQKVIGIIIAIQVIMGLIIAFKDKLF